MVPTTSRTLSQGHGLFSRNSHLQRFRTVVCLQLPAVMQQSHRRQEGSTWPLYDLWLWNRDVPKGTNPNHGTVLICFRNFLLFIFQVSGGFYWSNYCVSFVESNLPQLILIVTSRSLIDPSPLDPSTWFLGSHWVFGQSCISLLVKWSI